MKKDYDRLQCCLCCLGKFSRKKMSKNDRKILEERKKTVEACKKIIDERLDLVNFIKDSMKFQIISGLLLKARHHALVPLLTISLACDSENKKKDMDINESYIAKPDEEVADEEVADEEVADEEVADEGGETIRKFCTRDTKDPIFLSKYVEKVESPSIQVINQSKYTDECSNDLAEAIMENLRINGNISEE